MPMLRANSFQSAPCLSLRAKRRINVGLVEDFGPVCITLFALVLILLINLVALAAGAATAMLETNEAVCSAAVQEGHKNSLDAMYSTCEKFFTMRFAKSTGLTAYNGYAACGMDLYIQITPPCSNPFRQAIPNTPLSSPVDLVDNVYEFVGVNHVSIKPLISLANIPILSGIPGLGKPAFFELTATRMVEHPRGLAYDKSAQTSAP